MATVACSSSFRALTTRVRYCYFFIYPFFLILGFIFFDLFLIRQPFLSVHSLVFTEASLLPQQGSQLRELPRFAPGFS